MTHLSTPYSGLSEVLSWHWLQESQRQENRLANHKTSFRFLHWCDHSVLLTFHWLKDSWPHQRKSRWSNVILLLAWNVSWTSATSSSGGYRHTWKPWALSCIKVPPHLSVPPTHLTNDPILCLGISLWIDWAHTNSSRVFCCGPCVKWWPPGSCCLHNMQLSSEYCPADGFSVEWEWHSTFSIQHLLWGRPREFLVLKESSSYGAFTRSPSSVLIFKWSLSCTWDQCYSTSVLFPR